jgi:hypothetical protein
MATLSLTVRLDGTGPDGTERPLWNKNKQITSLTSAPHVMNHYFTGSDVITVYDPTVDGLNPITDFDFLFIVALTGTAQVEFTCNEGNANEALDVKTLAVGVPLILGADDSVFGTAVNQGLTGNGGGSGTADVIDKIRIMDTSAAANNVLVIMGT